MNKCQNVSRRGLYGTNDGAYCRGGKDAGNVGLMEAIADNETVEGPIVKTLRRMAGEHDWTAFQQYTDELVKQGHSKGRVNSMIASAMAGLKL